jgi:hypothetical protein
MNKGLLYFIILGVSVVLAHHVVLYLVANNYDATMSYDMVAAVLVGIGYSCGKHDY